MHDGGKEGQCVKGAQADRNVGRQTRMSAPQGEHVPPDSLPRTKSLFHKGSITHMRNACPTERVWFIRGRPSNGAAQPLSKF